MNAFWWASRGLQAGQRPTAACPPRRCPRQDNLPRLHTTRTPQHVARFLNTTFNNIVGPDCRTCVATWPLALRNSWPVALSGALQHPLVPPWTDQGTCLRCPCIPCSLHACRRDAAAAAARRRAVVSEIYLSNPETSIPRIILFRKRNKCTENVKGHDRGASFSFICHSAAGNLVIFPKETDALAVGNLFAATCEDHQQDDET